MFLTDNIELVTICFFLVLAVVAVSVLLLGGEK